MDAQLTKSLTDLIDETLQELDELRKSRFAAAEIKIEGPGDGIAGKPSDGDLHAKAEDKKDDEEDEDKKKDDMDKAEDKKEDDPADSDKTKADLKELMGKKEDKEDEKDEKAEKHPKKKETAEAAKEILDMHKGEMKKSLEATESLMKSYVEERVKPLEDKLATILDLVNKIADQPVAPKGLSVKAAPLFKSAEGQEAELLSKAVVASKLFELKKSGTSVDTLDIAKADLGQDLENIVKKYKLS